MIGRRAVLAGAAVGGVAAALWAARELSDPVGEFFDESGDAPATAPDPTAVAPTTLPIHRELAGATLVYEISGDPTPLRIEEVFARRLEDSLRSHWQAAGWGAPATLTSYGTWIDTDGPADSWHHAGRAFDVGRVVSASGDEVVSCRYDRWGDAPAAARRAEESAYWRLAATLHRDFEYVLTYLYDEAHHNHIHVDDGRSRGERSAFRRGSRVQVQAVQAMCRHVWGLDVDVTDRWDDATRAATEGVLDRLGVGGRLTGDEQWHAFLTATARGGPPV